VPLVTRLERSKWTSTAPRMGLRHFEVAAVRGSGPATEVELRGVLTPAVRLSVPLRELLDRAHFRPGWQPLPLPDEPGGRS
jgi:tryptophan-rich hypothetical protein